MSIDAQSIVIAAVLAELREVLTTRCLHAEVSARQSPGPVSVSQKGPTVVIDLPLGDCAVLTELLRKNVDG